MIGLGRDWWGEPARAGWGEAGNRRAPVKVPPGPAPQPPTPPLPSPTPGAHARRRPGRCCGTRRRSGSWVVPGRYLGDPRGDVTAAGQAGVQGSAPPSARPTSPIVPRGVASRPPPPRVPLAVTAKVSGWPEPDRTGHRLGRGKRKRGAPRPRPRAAG